MARRLLPLARAARKSPTAQEDRLWRLLRNRQLDDWKFRRQHLIAGFIVDFTCAEAKLIVEVDGDSHAGREAADAERTQRLMANGWRVVRFSNAAVRDDIDGVLETILEELPNRREPPPTFNTADDE